MKFEEQRENKQNITQICNFNNYLEESKEPDEQRKKQTNI
jgi:hypothetical protein